MKRNCAKSIAGGIIWVFLLTSLVSGAPADTVRIACVGNSITYGAGITYRNEDSYPAQLGKLLGPDYLTANFGVSGRTMLKKGDYPLWNEPEFTVALNFNPNIVLILLGTNDSKPWNWEFKADYIPDYIAMIDTFKQLASNPHIYACYPPPAFRVEWGIRDSVINADIIPMIDQIISQTGVSLIDFNTPFKNQADLFPDAIHPSAEGACEMAKIVYKELTGKTVQRIKDADLVRRKTVQVQTSGVSSNPEYLVDGDRTTGWICSGTDNAAIIDFGVTETIDMFQTDFGDLFALGWQYTIEISLDANNWQMVVDQSARQDTVQRVAIDSIEPTEARYVKLTVLRALEGTFASTVVNDFRVLRAAPVHPPIFLFRFSRVRATSAVFEMDVLPVSKKGELIKLYRASKPDEPFTALKSYRQAIPDQIRASIRNESLLKFMGLAFKDDLEIVSDDTLVVNWAMTGVKTKAHAGPARDFRLNQNFPNPFNPVTSISFVLNHSAPVTIEIFDLTGRLVHRLRGQTLAAGSHCIFWNGRDATDRILPGGIYFYRLQAGESFSAVRKMVFLK